ncbi:Kinesin-like protein KAR3 [Spathaspora sp. JA1]|nr:Kinesin-like protein KAR3 [Spathaspora sp. JA1]
MKPQSQVANSLARLKRKDSQTEMTPTKRKPPSNNTNWSSLVSDKSSELTTLRTNVSTLKTQIENMTFSNYEIEQQYHELKRIVKELTGQIEELKSYEQASLDEIAQRFKFEYSKMRLDHDVRVNAKKEEISDEVEKILETRTRQYEKEIAALESKIEVLKGEISSIDKKFETKVEEMKQAVQVRHQELTQEIESEITKNNQDREAVVQEITQMEQEIFTNNTKIQELVSQKTRYSSILEQLQVKYQSKQPELANITNKIQSHTTKRTQLHEKSKTRSESSAKTQSEITQINQKLQDDDQLRRKLHARLQDLKGNIRVFCRIRPILPGQTPTTNITVPDDELDEDAKQEIRIVKPMDNQVLRFSFDKVFAKDASNNTIFEEISQLIQSSLDGSKVCVFAYGQTGSGKTYTMSHNSDGMIPLSITKIFQDVQELQTHGWEYTITGQFLEIYNDTIIDLLAPEDGNLKHEIKHDDATQTTKVTNATTVTIQSYDQAIDLLKQANTRRSTASTKANERSSRSHSIFMLSITGYNRLTNTQTTGTLNLIDLAGSERLAVSKAEGDRLRETQAINKSLSNLGDVIHALRQGDLHVPYRNSKLTYLLKHSLGSKTLMFVCVGSGEKEVNETINSLRFASKVNSTRGVSP